MRNVKLLWFIIIVLMLGLVAQLAFMFNMRADIARQPDNPQPIETDDPSGGKSGDPVEEDGSDGDPDQAAHTEETDRVIATVGGVQITEGEIREQAYAKYGKELLNQQIDHLVIQLEGEALGIRVDEADVMHELKKMQAGYDSEEDFYRMMAELGMNENSLREDAYYKLLSERIAMKGIEIPDEWVDQYMQNHPEEFQSFTKMRIHIIVTSTQAQAEGVVEDLQAGALFEELARDRSIDELTRSDHGDLGWVEEGDPFVDPRIMEMAMRMTVNEISPVIALDSTFAVIRLTARNEMDKEMSQQIREDVRKQLALQEAPSLQQILRELRSKYKVITHT